MDATEAKAIVRRLFDEVWNQPDAAARDRAIAELYHPDYVADYRPYGYSEGLGGITRMVRNAWATFPDYHEEMLQLIADGDTVVAHFRISGTQQGAWGPVPPSGKRLEFEEVAILRLQEGRVIHQRGIVDNLRALRQLGIMPVPPGQGS